MAKLKLNLPAGTVVEKPVVTCFNIDNKTYLILDAENIGSMGLPIILVCKIDSNKVVKITDANEWQQAKNYLKGIIAGNAMEYVKVAAELSAEEVYYTQLTLPVASFDVIKNNYKVEEEVVAPTDETPVVSEPVIETPKVEESAPEVAPIPVIEPVAPVTENTQVAEPVVPEIPAAPVVETPAPEVPVIDIQMPNDTNVANAPEVAPIMPAIPNNEEVVAPVVETNESDGTIDFQETKEAFLTACENMFEALAAKFQAELDSKK